MSEIKAFFDKDDTNTNASPTAILVGISPDAMDRVQILTRSEIPELVDRSTIGKEPIECDVVIDFNLWNSAEYEELADEIDALYEGVRDSLLAAGQENDHENENETEDEDEDDEDSKHGSPQFPDDAAQLEQILEQDTDDDDDFEAEDEPESDLVADSELDDQNDPDAAFFHDLTPAGLSEICKKRTYLEWPQELQEKIVELLKDERKPGLIIDGQHRVSATKGRQVPFLVSLLPDASWAELAFQFIVNNSSAKKVDDNLLFAIVGESLDEDQLNTIEARLNKSGIKVSLIKASMRVQLDPNPFQDMLKTNTPGHSGFLDATAMQRKVISLWYGSRGRTGNRPTWQKFRAIKGEGADASREFNMSDLFIANCPGDTKLDKTEAWQKHLWFQYFSAFWSAVQERYEQDGLWPRSKDNWPTSKSVGRATADEKRVLSLMGATILMLLQLCVLQTWADRRFYRLKSMKGHSLQAEKISPSAFKEEIAEILEPLSADFFTSYKKSGPDASKEVRQAFMKELISVLEERQTVAQVKERNTMYFNND